MWGAHTAGSRVPQRERGSECVRKGVMGQKHSFVRGIGAKPSSSGANTSEKRQRHHSSRGAEAITGRLTLCGASHPWQGVGAKRCLGSFPPKPPTVSWHHPWADPWPAEPPAPCPTRGVLGPAVPLWLVPQVLCLHAFSDTKANPPPQSARRARSFQYRERHGERNDLKL